MKNEKRNRVAPFLLSLLLVVQSCQVYKTSSISLEEATIFKGKVKVQTTDGKRIKFKQINREEEIYYGVKKKKGEIVRKPLNQEDIVAIYPKHNTASMVNTVVLTSLVAVFVIGIGISLFGWGN